MVDLFAVEKGTHLEWRTDTEEKTFFSKVLVV